MRDFLAAVAAAALIIGTGAVSAAAHKPAERHARTAVVVGTASRDIPDGGSGG